MGKNRFFGLAAIVATFGCATVSTAPTPDSSLSFSPSDVAWARERGGNSIAGNALLRTVGGDVKTCAGFTADLVPASDYARDRVRIIYGSAVGGFVPYFRQRSVPLAKPGYVESMRTATCDSLGNFEFNGLPDGTYFVATEVGWQVPGQFYTMSKEGGVLGTWVTVSGNEAKRIVLTN